MKPDITIYKITNTINGKCYIGKTSNSIKTRFQVHIRNARNKINRKLYDAMNKYGYDFFIVTELEVCSNEKGDVLEIHYIKAYNSFSENGYNMTIGGDGGNTGKYYSKSPYEWIKENKGEEEAQRIKNEAYKKVSKSLSIYCKGKSLEERWGKEKAQNAKSKISNSIKALGIKPPINHWERGNHPMLGKTHTEESRKKMSNVRKGKGYDEIYGKEKSDELKAKKSELWKGKQNPNSKPDLTDIEIRSIFELLLDLHTLKEISKKINISESRIRKVIRSFGIKNLQIEKRKLEFKTLIANILKT